MKLNNVTPKSIKLGSLSTGLPIETFRYVMFEILDNHGDSITTVGDISFGMRVYEYPQVAMTGFNSPSPYSITDYSSYYNNDPLYEPWKAFDDQHGTNNRWLTDQPFPQYVTIDLSQSINVSDFQFVAVSPGSHISSDYGSRAIKDFNVKVSNDGVTWRTVLTQTGVDNWEAGGVKKYFYLDTFVQ